MAQKKTTVAVFMILLGVFAWIIFAVNQHVSRELQDVEADAAAYRPAPAAPAAVKTAPAREAAPRRSQVQPPATGTAVQPPAKEEKIIYEMPATDVILIQ
jgi:hypothetical protein